jgi:hypothetical protein
MQIFSEQSYNNKNIQNYIALVIYFGLFCGYKLITNNPIVKFSPDLTRIMLIYYIGIAIGFNFLNMFIVMYQDQPETMIFCKNILYIGCLLTICDLVSIGFWYWIRFDDSDNNFINKKYVEYDEKYTYDNEEFIDNQEHTDDNQEYIDDKKHINDNQEHTSNDEEITNDNNCVNDNGDNTLNNCQDKNQDNSELVPGDCGFSQINSCKTSQKNNFLKIDSKISKWSDIDSTNNFDIYDDNKSRLSEECVNEIRAILLETDERTIRLVVRTINKFLQQ